MAQENGQNALPIGAIGQNPSLGQEITFAALLFRYGICVPDSCSDEKVVQILERKLCSVLNG